MELTAQMADWRRDQSDFCTKWTLANRMHPSLVPVRNIASQCTSLSVLCVRSWAYATDICQLQFSSTTSPVRENAGLSKCRGVVQLDVEQTCVDGSAACGATNSCLFVWRS